MNATTMQPSSVTTLANGVLARNKQRNHNATQAKMECNFQGEKNDRLLHAYNETGNGNPFPVFCQVDCHSLEELNLPGEGPVLGCVDPRDPTHWQRLDRLKACLAKNRKPVVPLPDWCCGYQCEYFSQTDFRDGSFIRKCWYRGFGRKSGLLHNMTGCPARG